MADADVLDTAAVARKLPTQERSRVRVERMLSAAVDLIGANGSDALRMSEVAERAGVSIGSLYQFFPDKTALIGALVERVNVEGRRCIGTALAGVTDESGLRAAFSDLFDVYYALFLAEPAMRDIWSGAQADKALRAIQLSESRKNGALLASAMRKVSPDAAPGDIEMRALLVMHLGEDAIRLAISVGADEGRRLVEGFKQMALRTILPDAG